MRRGDWVVYEAPGKREIGRVWVVGQESAAVCYSLGCTAARTPLGLLRPYDRDRDGDLVPDSRIGHHRFDDDCPDYDDACCHGCKPAMAKRGRKAK